MMKILIACKEFPHSKVIGGPILIYNRLKHLAKNHLVSLTAFCHPGDEKYIPSVRPLCHDLRLVHLPPKRSLIKTTLDFFTSPIPHYFLRVHGSAEMAHTIAEMVKKDNYDFVIAEYSVMGQFLHKNPELPATRRIMSVHECYYLARLKSYRHHKLGPSKWKEAINLKGLKKYEFDMYRNADKVLTLTPQGKKELLAISPDLDIAIIPHGVDVDAFSFTPEAGEKNSLVFLGNYLHYPNVDAVLYFHETIWPSLKKALPQLKFYVVGQAPPPEITRLAEDKSIVVTGKVDDVTPFLRRGKVFICPVRLGGGFRGKILEAMALGRPVVSTRLGAEGIPASSGENIILADTPKDFIRGIADLIENAGLYLKIQNNARRLMEDHYAWDKGVAQLEAVLEDMMSKPPLNQSEGRIK
jgi:glycosyltransferase involved in cell wall biosynthesis